MSHGVAGFSHAANERLSMTLGDDLQECRPLRSPAQNKLRPAISHAGAVTPGMEPFHRRECNDAGKSGSTCYMSCSCPFLAGRSLTE